MPSPGSEGILLKVGSIVNLFTRHYTRLAKYARSRISVAPDPDNLAMLWEMIPPSDMDPFECLEQSWQFVRSLK